MFDPKGRQMDQMIQAARSGRQSIIEGSERAATSEDTEMKLTDVARASLSELRGDYEMWILAFEKTGGFSERLTARRIEARHRACRESPACPQCGKPMRQRNSVKGVFWGCSDFPQCKGTRAIQGS